MLFTEPLFFAFFAGVFGLYWALPSDRARKLWLLAASYVFYAAWDWRFLGLIFASTALDYVVGLGLGRSHAPGPRRAWVSASIVGNLGLLGCFKYFDFFVTSANSLLGWLGLDPGLRTLEIVLPIGISFYTFQTLSYTIDVYRGRMEVVRDFPDFALFVAFFPQLVMGPILRAVAFIPQLGRAHRFADVDVKPLLVLFLIGFVKKTCVSDNVAPIVDGVYADPTGFTALAIWIASLLYAVQIYCDFSGYSDMAIAIAGLLGYQVPTNFAFPFFARDITDFWRRWHVSLSSWLQLYLFTPLGRALMRRLPGRLDAVAIAGAQLVTMTLCGLWHGAGWNFVLWGVLHGVALVVHRGYTRLEVPEGLRRLSAAVGVPLTFLWFVFTLIFFRSETAVQMEAFARAFVTFQASGSEGLPLWTLGLLAVLALAHFVAMKKDLASTAARLGDAPFAFGLGAAFALALACVRLEYRPFIYFQF